MLCLTLLTVLLVARATQIEFNLTAVVDSVTAQKRAYIERGVKTATTENKIAHHAVKGVDVSELSRVAKRHSQQAAPQPCGGHNYLPPVALCTPARIVPTTDAIPSGAGKDVLVVGASRGIGNAVANMRAGQGAQVTGTCTELNLRQRERLEMGPMEPLVEGISLIELDYGLDGEPSLKSPERVVRRLMRQRQGKLPDEIYLIGNNANSGNPEDYTLEERLYNERVHNTGWHTLLIELLKYRKFPQNVNRSVSVMFFVSAGAYAPTPGVLDGWYYPGHNKKLQYTRHQNVKQLTNWRFRTLAGFFVNSTYWRYTKNPSAAKGDTANLEYLWFTQNTTLKVGNSVQEAATASIQVNTLPLGGANHFQLLPHQLPAPAPYTDWSAGSFRTLENNFEDPLFTQAVLGGMATLQIHMNQHGSYELPAYEYDGDW